MGKTSDDDYAILLKEFAEERETLDKKIVDMKEKMRQLEDSAGERDRFIKAIRKFMQMKWLSNSLLRELSITSTYMRWRARERTSDSAW